MQQIREATDIDDASTKIASSIRTMIRKKPGMDPIKYSRAVTLVNSLTQNQEIEFSNQAQLLRNMRDLSQDREFDFYVRVKHLIKFVEEECADLESSKSKQYKEGKNKIEGFDAFFFKQENLVKMYNRLAKRFRDQNIPDYDHNYDKVVFMRALLRSTKYMYNIDVLKSYINQVR
jgi:hypothetical protein